MLGELLLWSPWFIVGVVLVAMWRFKRSTLVLADPARARGKFVVVTGAAMGIGLATAMELLRLGANVYACDINMMALNEAFAGFGSDRVKKIKVDVTKQADCDELRRICTEVHGVVNCAGVASPPGRTRTMLLGAAELDVDVDVQPVFDVNLYGTIRVNSTLFPLLFETKGTIVNIASVAGRLAAPGLAVYAATKHAVVAYSASCRRELEPYAMPVYCVEPGFTSTPMVTKSLAPEGADLSRTRLHRTFGKVSDKIQGTIGTLQSVERVSTAICACLFAERLPPHFVVDENKFWLFTIASMLPHSWIDAAIAFGIRRSQSQ
jgi:NAD(P)-dependent dehydrogenase (short-subunit alcohol dehydrogenase family)